MIRSTHLASVLLATSILFTTAHSATAQASTVAESPEALPNGEVYLEWSDRHLRSSH